VAFWNAVGEAMFGDEWDSIDSYTDEDESDEEEMEEGDSEGEEQEVEPQTVYQRGHGHHDALFNEHGIPCT
jgi:hypothetical protein